MKIAYCGFDFFSACLNQLLNAGYNVYRVFSIDTDNQYNFNHYIKELCQLHNLPLSFDRINKETIRELEQESCDLLITATYQYKIPDLINSPIKGINLHPSLLPIGRGPWSLPRTIFSQQKESGVTVHKLTPEFDAGDILLQKIFPLSAHEHLESLSCKLQIAAKDIIVETLKHFSGYWDNATAQADGYEYWPMPDRQDRSLDWNQDVETIDRIVRAFGKFESFAHFDNQDWLVSDVKVWKVSHTEKPGNVVHRTNTEMVVAASDGLVCLRYFTPRRLQNK